MFSSIVVAFDGSPHATRALGIAAELAASDQIPLGIVYVVDLNHIKIPDGWRRMGEVEHIIDSMPKMLFDLDKMPAHIMSSMEENVADSARAFNQYAEFILKQAKKGANKTGVKTIETRVVEGDPAEQILEYARSRQADLIVIGSLGFGPLKSMVLGSTSHKVAQHSNCSCLTVK